MRCNNPSWGVVVMKEIPRLMVKSSFSLFRLILLCFPLLSLPACSKHGDALPASCNLIPDPGMCYAAIPKVYFDQEDGACKEFTWGGCGGVVPFDSMEECQCQCQ